MAEARRGRGKRRGKEYWQGEVKKLSKSGQTVAEYSRREGINAHRLYKWKRKLKVVNNPDSRGFVELPIALSESLLKESYEIYIKPALHIRIGGYYKQDTLKHLIEVLRRVQ